MDINFSQSIKNDATIFFRPLEFAEFTTSSGVAFTFPAEMETELKESWLKWDELDSSRRFAKFLNSARKEAYERLMYEGAAQPEMHNTGLAPAGKRREKSRLLTCKRCLGLNPPGL